MVPAACGARRVGAVCAVPIWSPQYQSFVSVVTIGLLSAMYDEKRLHKEVGRECWIWAFAVGSMLEGANRSVFSSRLDRKPLPVKPPTCTTTRSSSRRISMTWQPELDELARREAFAREMGGADKVKRQHDRPAHRARAHRRAGRSRQLPRDRRDRRRAEYEQSGELTDLHAGELRVRPRQASTAGRWSSSATISPCAAARPMRRSGEAGDGRADGARVAAADRAHHRRLRRRRLGEDDRDQGRANLPGGVGGTRWYWYTIANMATVPVVALGLGSVAGLGAARLAASHYSVMIKDVGDVRRRPAGGEARSARTSPRRSSAAAKSRPAPARVDHAVDTEEEAFACARRFCPICRRRSTSCRRASPRRRSGARARNGCSKAVPRDRRKVYRMRRSSRRWSTRARSSRWAPISAAPIITGFARLDGWPVAAGERSVSLRRRRGPRSLPEDRALRRSRRDLPSAGRLSDGLPGLHDRARGREGGDDPPRRARDGRGQPDDGAVVHDHRAQRVRRRRRVHQPASRYSIRYAWPSAYWGSLPLEGGIEAAYRAEIDAAPTIRRPSCGDRGAAQRCARRSARPRRSGSRRSSIRATRARCCANSRGSPSRCAAGPADEHDDEAVTSGSSW